MLNSVSTPHIMLAAVVATLAAGCSQSAPSQSQISGADLAVLAASPPAAPAANGMMDHSHIPVEIPAGVETPTLSLEVSRDWMSGLNLILHTEHYVMMPPPDGLSMSELMSPSIDAASGVAEGHAHLYINGVKIQRVYGESIHLPETLFKPGLNQINVTINNHGHMYWTADQRQVMATLYINLDNEELVTHRFESSPMLKSADGSTCTTVRET